MGKVSPNFTAFRVSQALNPYMAIFDYSEVFYNRQRLHSSIAYAAPVSTAN